MGAPIKWKDLKNKEWFDRGVLIATVAFAVFMMISVFTGSDAARLGTKELAAEVGELLRKNMTEVIKSGGAKQVDVKINELSLFRDGGDNYHGLVVMECKYDGVTAKLSKVIRVTYDGEKFMYHLEK